MDIFELNFSCVAEPGAPTACRAAVRVRAADDGAGHVEVACALDARDGEPPAGNVTIHAAGNFTPAPVDARARLHFADGERPTGCALRVLVDRSVIEVYAQDGRVAMSHAAVPADAAWQGVDLLATAGDVLVDARVYRMGSAFIEP